MATFTKTMSGDSRYYVQLEVTETGTSVENNTSTVSYTFKAYKSSGSGYWTSNSNNPVKVTLDGIEIVNKTISYDFRNKSNITLASGTTTITHESDGTKNLTCKGYFKDNNNSLGNATASGNLALSELPRGSDISYTGDLILGSSKRITINSSNVNYKHTLSYRFNATSGNFTTIATNIQTSYYDWTPPLSLAQQIPNDTSARMTLKCDTYKSDGTTLIGTYYLGTVAYVPDNLYPSISISNPTVGGETPSSWGIFVKGKSTATYTITGTGVQGSTIASYESTVDGYTYTTANVTTNVLTTAGTNTITGKVVDSRGKQKETTKTFNVYDYNNPTISVAEVQRCDANGNIDSNGNYCHISFDGSVTSLSNHNSGVSSFLIKYKIHENQQYSSITVASHVSSYSGTGILYTDGIYPANRGSGTKLQLPSTNTYDIQFYVSDYYTESTNTQILDTGFDLLNFNPSGKSMAIGKVSEATADEELLEVALDTEFTGEVNGGTINFTASSYHDSTKQDTLVSGTNIKTINNTSVVGPGNILVQPTLSITTGTLSITKTSGNSTATGTYAKYGNIVAVNINLTTTDTINSGSNIFVGTISNFTPAINTCLVGFIGGRSIIAGFGTDNLITVRNASSTNLSSNSSVGVRGTFIIE